jgi:hypothetical protein
MTVDFSCRHSLTRIMLTLSGSATARGASMTTASAMTASPSSSSAVMTTAMRARRRSAGCVAMHSRGLLRRTGAAGATRRRRATRSASSASGQSNFDKEDVAQWVERVRKEPWDARAKTWREFFAARANVAVLEVDVDSETVKANEIETHGLNFPKDTAEAWSRVKANSVRFRQNYLAVACASALFGCECAAFGAALVCFYAFAAFKSDVILGEIALATNGKLAWNATRVAGVNRATAQKATLALAVVLFVLSDAAANVSALFRSMMTAFMIALAHAVLRPIDLKGTLTDIMKDLKGAKSKEDLARAAEAGVKGFKSWWSNRRDAEPVPVVVVTKDSRRGAAQQQQGNQQDPPRRRENGEGAIDVEGREAPNRKFLP